MTTEYDETLDSLGERLSVPEIKSYLMQSKDGDPVELETIVFLALGMASACWSNLSGAGIFHSTRCKHIGMALMQAIEEKKEAHAALIDRKDVDRISYELGLNPTQRNALMEMRA